MKEIKTNILEKVLIGTGFVLNLSTDAVGLTTNIDDKYIYGLIAISILSCISGGLSFSYRDYKSMEVGKYENEK